VWVVQLIITGGESIVDILAGVVIGVILLVGVAGFLKERQRRKEAQHS